MAMVTVGRDAIVVDKLEMSGLVDVEIEVSVRGVETSRLKVWIFSLSLSVDLRVIQPKEETRA